MQALKLENEDAGSAARQRSDPGFTRTEMRLLRTRNRGAPQQRAISEVVRAQRVSRSVRSISIVVIEVTPDVLCGVWKRCLCKNYILRVLEQLPEGRRAWGAENRRVLSPGCVYEEIDQVPDTERC